MTDIFAHVPDDETMRKYGITFVPEENVFGAGSAPPAADRGTGVGPRPGAEMQPQQDEELALPPFDASQRVKNKVYKAHDGRPIVWTGKGFLHVDD